VFQLTIWSIAPLAAAAISLTAYLRAQPRDRVPGGHALRFLFLTLFIWSSAHTLAMIMGRPAAIELASQFAYLGIALTPVAWFVFAVTYSQRVRKIPRHTLNTVCLVPAVTVILALTNSWHGLIWRDRKFVEIDGFLGMVTTHGFWFYVHAVYSYSLILIATAILAFALLQYKQHYQTVLVAVFAPIVAVLANLFYLSPHNPYPWLDLTALGFVAAVLLLDMGVLRRALLHTAPIARERVVEQLKDPVLVLAHDGTVLDANQSALTSWEDQEPLLNSNVSRIIHSLPTRQLMDAKANSEATIKGRAYEIAATPLDATNDETDVAVVFRDVTERRSKERELHNMKTRLEHMAHTDVLTNLYNRRFFMERLGEEFERVRRHGSMLSVLVFDLDRFKRINDTYGHDNGDRVLVSVAEVVNRIKRVTDIACRLGGEEFALLLPETDKSGAINLAQRLRRAIEDHPYQTSGNERLTVTASIGVATVTPQSPEPESILQVADRGLYRAKDSGRNAVCFEAQPAV
jgi:diguanylate cyclase (GGDEF)-like protein